MQSQVPGIRQSRNFVSKFGVQKYSSDARFMPKMAIFKQTMLNIANIKILKIFPSARESLSIQTSASEM